VREVSAAAAMSQTASTGAKLKPHSLDDLGRAILLLATEVAVLNDRQRVLEAVLEERGIAVADAVRDHQPAGALADTLKAEKARLAQAIVEVLCPSES
jgi:hypothetical protein